MATQIFAHRGCSGGFPENTWPAFRAAVEADVDGIELDVHLSKDNQLIVMHDETVDRTTNGKGQIKDLTLAEIKKLDAGANFPTKSIYAAVPTFPEIFALLKEKHFTGILNIEIKTDVIAYEGIEEILAKEVNRRSIPFQMIFSSFHLPSLEKFHQLLPDASLGYITRLEEEKAEIVKNTPYLEALHPRINWLHENKRKLAVYPKPIRSWTVNKESDMRFCFKHNIAGFFTNYPELAMKIREEYDG